MIRTSIGPSCHQWRITQPARNSCCEGSAVASCASTGLSVAGSSLPMQPCSITLQDSSGQFLETKVPLPEKLDRLFGRDVPDGEQASVPENVMATDWESVGKGLPDRDALRIGAPKEPAARCRLWK
jgi:hypothetical protein